MNFETLLARAFGLRQHGAQLVHHLQRHRVALRRAIERDLQHATLTSHGEGLELGQLHAHDALPGKVPSSLQMMPSITSSAPPPMLMSRLSR